jgi:hypothetical protein
MKMLSLSVWTIVLGATIAPTLGQAPASPPAPSVKVTVLGSSAPETKSYQQYQLQEYQNSVALVHQNAAFRATQRMRRLAAMHWFGLSNSRPQASVDPINGDYSPAWVSNVTAHPFQWQGVGP